MTEEQLKKRAEGYAKKIEKELLEDYEPKEYGTTPYFATIPTPHNRQAFIDGYHECQKEHEWHYVKDGDLPKENKDCLVVFHNKYSDNIVKDISRYSVELKKWWFIHDLKDMEEEVIAWKEIVLPELKEINN